jgi:hypothetical protein
MTFKVIDSTKLNELLIWFQATPTRHSLAFISKDSWIISLTDKVTIPMTQKNVLFIPAQDKFRAAITPDSLCFIQTGTEKIELPSYWMISQDGHFGFTYLKFSKATLKTIGKLAMDNKNYHNTEQAKELAHLRKRDFKHELTLLEEKLR